MASGEPEAAICVQDIDVQCVLQFTLINAAGCALHRRTNPVIHRQECFTVRRTTTADATENGHAASSEVHLFGTVRFVVAEAKQKNRRQGGRSTASTARSSAIETSWSDSLNLAGRAAHDAGGHRMPAALAAPPSSLRPPRLRRKRRRGRRPEQVPVRTSTPVSLAEWTTRPRRPPTDSRRAVGTRPTTTCMQLSTADGPLRGPPPRTAAARIRRVAVTVTDRFAAACANVRQSIR